MRLSRTAVLALTLWLSPAWSTILAAQGESLRVTLLGTGSPRPTLERFGPSILVEAGPRLAVYSHIVLRPGATSDDLPALTRPGYAEALVVGEDLMRLTVGDSVTVDSAPR